MSTPFGSRSSRTCRQSEACPLATVCVFTPTYNRAYILPKLYESLVAQTSRGFSWLVVDDGSTDGMAVLVRGCEDELFFVVDSGDHLVPTAIEQIIDVWQDARGDEYMRHKRDSARRETNPYDAFRETTLYLVGCIRPSSWGSARGTQRPSHRALLSARKACEHHVVDVS